MIAGYREVCRKRDDWLSLEPVGERLLKKDR
jgi:hypothetical protein